MAPGVGGVVADGVRAPRAAARSTPVALSTQRDDAARSPGRARARGGRSRARVVRRRAAARRTATGAGAHAGRAVAERRQLGREHEPRRAEVARSSSAAGSAATATGAPSSSTTCTPVGWRPVLQLDVGAHRPRVRVEDDDRRAAPPPAGCRPAARSTGSARVDAFAASDDTPRRAGRARRRTPARSPIPARMSWNWLKRICFQARVSSAVRVGEPPSELGDRAPSARRAAAGSRRGASSA